jgi:hypothetical protein
VTRGNPWLGLEETELQFEVNGPNYFLAFVEDERRWFAPRAQGALRIPVYVDAPATGMLTSAEEGKHSILN